MVLDMVIDTLLEQSINYDARAAHDSANWQREMYVADDTPNWLIVRVEPAPDSGAATVPGGYINAETGELEMPAGARTALVKSGRWHRVDGTAPEAAGNYHWFEPMVEDKRRMDPEDVYSPFVHGGTLLFAPDREADGIEQFGASILLFEDWVAAAPQAIAMNLPSEDAMAEPSPALRDALSRARGSENPLVAAWAWRHSLALDSDRTPAELDMASGHVLAVRTRLMLDVGSEVSVRDVLQAVGATNDLSRLEAMALGAFSAVQLPSAGRGKSAREALVAIGEKAHSLDPEGKAGPRLRAILTLAGYARQ
jgi:hypothetical protein